MKRVPLLIVIGAVGWFGAACHSSSGKNSATSDAASQLMTDQEEAANTLYLGDAVDSAGDPDAEAPEGMQDPSANEDCKSRRLEQMANMVMDKLDGDASGGLSLEEFLGIVSKMKLPSNKDKSDQILAKIKARLTEEFKKAAGDDSMLSLDELKALLKSQGPRVGRFRARMFPEGHEERLKDLTEKIIAKFDKDGDGKLSSEELEEALKSRQEDCDRWKMPRKMPPAGKPADEKREPMPAEGSP